METILVHLLIWVIVAAIVMGVIKAIPDTWLEAWLKRIVLLVFGGVLLIALILYVLLPLIHVAGGAY